MVFQNKWKGGKKTKIAIILGFIIGMFGLVALESDASAQGAIRNSTTTITDLAGNMYENDCTDPPSILTVVEGERIETEVTLTLPDGSVQGFLSIKAHGIAQDENNNLYRISERAQGKEAELNGVETEV